MYFKDNKSTNIDDEFENKDILSNTIGIINKYKIILITAIVILIIILIIVFLLSKKESSAKNIINYLDILGNETITIYEDSEYIELGYKAYNSNNEILTNEVKINSNLNSKEVGNYEIKYIFENIEKVRKIKVVEKPKSYTYIYLNSINNDTNIYLKLGEKYQEPGFQVFSSSNPDLTDKVEVTGNIDINKKGSYILTYSVIDDMGVTVTKNRIVNVLDPVINLKLNTEEFTNDDVTINIDIEDKYFDYMILPDGNKINSNKYTYKVTTNGTYRFQTYNQKGIEKESSIKITNIDKIAPTGTCKGSYRDGKSTININANDNISIDYYEINGKKYSDNKININEELKIANIKIFDKAGNEKTISCTLKKEIKEIDKIYTESNSHTNSINNIRYLLYNQTDPRWASYGYSQYNSNIGEMGCHITSAAVIASAYDNNITPLTVYNGYSGSYPYYSVNKLAGDGFTCNQIGANDSKDKIISLLKEGKVVVIMAYGKKKGGSNPFTSSQHYMALIDYKNSKIFVGNSYSNSGYGKSGWYSENEVLKSVEEVNVCTPTQKLLDKFN